MAPRVQYATTSDGVKIAYTIDGQGQAVVYLQPYSNQQLDWRHPEMVNWYLSLARDYSLIRYDGRNFGLSQRNAVLPWGAGADELRIGLLIEAERTR